MIANLLIFLLASAAAAATGILFQPGEWYRRLNKPSFTPPDIAFPIAWTIIYLLSAIAATRVAGHADAAEVGLALALWAAQIALNTLWTPVFFGAHRIRLGMAIISTLWLVVATMTVVFLRMDTLAGMMLLPYLAWLCIAAGLNWRIWHDNPEAVAAA